MVYRDFSRCAFSVKLTSTKVCFASLPRVPTSLYPLDAPGVLAAASGRKPTSPLTTLSASAACTVTKTFCDTSCAETKPEPSSRTGRLCCEQRRTWKQEQKLLLFPVKIPFYRENRADRDTAVPVTQCNELCIVTLYHTYPPRSNHQSS